MALFLGLIGGSLLVWLGLSWSVPALLGLSGNDYYIVSSILSILGIIGAAVVVWWKKRNDSSGLPADLTEAAEAGSGDELDLLVKDAEVKLAASRVGSGARIGNLPLVFVIGDQGATKTSIVLHSGLDPELLAGQVYGDGNLVAPTRTANLWLGRQLVLAEAGAKVLADPARWVRLVRRLRPTNLKSVVGKEGQAPRAALVCVNAEIFTQAGGSEQLAAMSRAIGERLGQISQALGISFPVYVLFTRCDRLPFFAEYVRTLTNDEANQVLGATVPMRLTTGIYAEEQAQRLTAAYDALFHSLADKRIQFLPREGDADKIPGAYEFPREFRKLRNPIVQFLVDLCRPSQLRASPFLRGFYFTGVRPVTVQDAPVTAPRPSAQRSASAAGSATGVFQVPGFQPAAAQASAPQYTGTKRVPQWLFLPRLFHEIILQDRAAFGASVASTKTSALQRWLLAAACVMLLLLGTVWTISFFRNRQMIGNAVTAAEAIPAAEAAGNNVASLDSLQRLETLRQALEQITRYKTEGHPMSMGWGLFAGDDVLPHVREAYYKRFAQLLFRQGQGALTAHLSGLPVAPRPDHDYQLTYDVLKGYLITTTDSRRADETSPAPILLKRWSEGRSVDAARTDLADKQFRFYAGDLKNGNPFSSTAEVQPVQRGRAFLAQFSGTERVYQYMLSQASKKNANFNRDVAGSAQAVVNNRDVPGAFTKEGYAFMQDALGRADQFFGGEKWVLCEATGNVPATNCAGGDLDRGKLAQDLSARYIGDFINAWRSYFRNTNVLGYSDLKDASQKLNLHAGPQSPILGLFWLASQNTGVDYTKIPGAERIGKAFQSVHAVVPPGQADRYVAPTNQAYHGALGMLQVSIDAAANMPKPDPGTVSGTLNNATNARGAIRQMSQNFNIDGEAHLEQTVQKLLEAPIVSAEGLLRSLGPKELNGKGAGLCAQISPILNKYPFNPASQTDSTLAEVSQMLKPGEGAIWAFYNMNLNNALVKQGAQYVPTGDVPLNPAFVSFFNTLARMSEALYRSGPEPKLIYTVRPLKSDGIQDLTLTIDGQAIPASGGPKQIQWPGGAQGARFSGKIGPSDLPSAPYEGLWAAFRLFNDAETFEPAGAGYNLEWVLRLQFGRSTGSTANAPRARYFIDLNGAPLFFRKAGTPIRCVPTVAR